VRKAKGRVEDDGGRRRKDREQREDRGRRMEDGKPEDREVEDGGRRTEERGKRKEERGGMAHLLKSAVASTDGRTRDAVASATPLPLPPSAPWNTVKKRKKGG
jgi:hypothetical protein